MRLVISARSAIRSKLPLKPLQNELSNAEWSRVYESESVEGRLLSSESANALHLDWVIVFAWSMRPVTRV
jgi:hypothetical protein